MKTIPLKDIVVSSSRQRQAFNPEALEQLKVDIEENGLYNAVVLRLFETKIPWPVREYHLVQGERRLRALSEIYALGGSIRHDGEDVPPGHVPYTTLGDLPPLQAEIAELHENLRRENLTWQEEMDATARIAAIRREMAEVEGKPMPSIEAITKEVHPEIPPEAKNDGTNAAFAKTQKQLVVSRKMADPDVRAAKSLNEAYKLVKRKEESERNATLAVAVGKTFSVDDHILLNQDALLWLKECPEGQFDVILTDPPYGMGADEFGDSAGKTAGAHAYKDDVATATFCMEALFSNALRVTKEQAHLLMFCDLDQFHFARERFNLAGWQVHRTPLIWHKSNSTGRIPWPEHGPRRSYELILYAVKGKKPVKTVGAPDVLSFPTEENLGHSAQKPVGLLAELLKRSASPGDSILDPFAGSGSLLPAAHSLKCRATLIEKDPASFGIILNRAKELK